MAAATLMQQARIAIREGRLVDARRLLRQVIHEEPQNHAAWLLLARATPDKKLASQYIDRARLLQPDSPLVQRAQDDLLSNKITATNKFSFSWLLIPIVVGTVLILSLVGIGYSNNTREQTALSGIESVAAAPAEAVQTKPTKIPQTNAEVFPTPETTSLQIIPTAVSSPQPNEEVAAEPAESQETSFEPAVISDPDQALPEAILRGINTEDASSNAVVITEEDFTSSASSQEDETDEESGAGVVDEAEITNPTEVTVDMEPDNAANDAVTEIEEETQNLQEEPESEAIVEDNTASEDPAQIASGERWIDVNLTTQTLTAYEGDTPVLYSVISSGMWQFPTVTGQYRTWIKYESQDMTGYHLGYNYSLDDVPHVMYFFEDYAIHGAYWHNNFGTPMSHGCVNVNLPDAEWLYNWAPLGTLVDVHQ